MKSELTDIDRTLLSTVVQRWLDLNEPTNRKALILRFKSPQRVDELVREGFFRLVDNDKYRPTFLAFEFCNDPVALGVARRSTAIALRTLRNMFELELEERMFRYEEIEAHARRIHDLFDPDDLKLGLYLSQEFGLFSGSTLNAAGTELGSVGISERIVLIEDFDSVWAEEVRNRTVAAQSLVSPAPELSFDNWEEGGGMLQVNALEHAQAPVVRRNEVRRSRLREILEQLSRLKLCGPSDDPDEQSSVIESYKYLLAHVRRLSKGVVSLEVRREIEQLSVSSIETIYDVYGSKADLDAIAIDISYDLDNPAESDETAERHLISPRLIDELSSARSKQFDVKKLLGYCREINSSFINENIVACLLLMRTVLNHVPPIFGQATFSQVAANSGKSLKENLDHLDAGLRKLADLYAHQTIRDREQYPTINQVEPFRAQFELLLHEVLNKLK